MKLNPSELLILKHLWRKQPLSMGEIHLSISEQLGWSRSSTRKTVERMVTKGSLRVSTSHGLNIYHAKAKKIPTLASLIKSFGQDVLGLDKPLPVSHLTKSNLLNESELEELEDYLDQLMRENIESQ